MPDTDERHSILIVDDDEGTCKTLELVLQRCGYTTRSVSSAQAAIDALHGQHFNLALLDIKLPDMAGTMLLSRLKKQDPDLVTVMLTAHASVDSVVRALNDGANAYLTKPFEMDQLLAVLREGCEKQRLVLENRRLLKQAQQELARRKEAERQRERLREQLYQADRMSALGMLAASVAHEINTPLAYMLYNLESLAEDLPLVAWAIDELKRAVTRPLTEGERRGLLAMATKYASPDTLEDMVDRARDALDGATHVRDVVKDLRTFSRVEAERNVPISLNQVLDCAINMATNDLKYRARLVRDYGEIPTITASDGRLSQVFLNLLVNAAQSIDEGNTDQNEIRIHTWTAEKEVCVEIADTGRGIAPEDLQRIFDPFFSTKPVGVGSGLGLSICNSIITSYGGMITAESEPGKGSRFVVRLPLDPLKRASREPTPLDLVPITSDGPRGRILVVDDEPNFGAAVRRMLIDEFDVVVAESGREGLDILSRDIDFDFIICDLLMPQVSGMDIFDALVADHPKAAERMIFVSGGAFTPLAAQFLSRVSNLRLEKPFDQKYLRTLLRGLRAGKLERA